MRLAGKERSPCLIANLPGEIETQAQNCMEKPCCEFGACQEDRQAWRRGRMLDSFEGENVHRSDSGHLVRVLSGLCVQLAQSERARVEHLGT
jgi:hypothetical protein